MSLGRGAPVTVCPEPPQTLGPPLYTITSADVDIVSFFDGKNWNLMRKNWLYHSKESFCCFFFIFSPLIQKHEADELLSPPLNEAELIEASNKS